MSIALASLMREPEPRPASANAGFLVFALIGGGAALGYVLLSSLMVSLAPAKTAWIVSGMCYTAFIVPVYLMHRRFTFRSDAAHMQALPRYVAVQMLALLLASFFGYVFHEMMDLPSLPASMAVIVLTSAINYLVLKGWAFAFETQGEAVAA